MPDSADRPVTVESLFDAHYRLVVRYIRRRIDDRELAEDLATECFVRALKHPKPSTIGIGWLIRTAHNLIGDQYRRRDREQRLLHELAISVSVAGAQAKHDSALVEALSQLSARDRELLMLLHVDGLPAPEVGVALGLTAAAVWKRSSRARARLRAQLTRRGEESFEGSVIAVGME